MIATTESWPCRGWLPLVVSPALVWLLTPATWPPWALMWMLAFAIYAGCKWLTWRRAPAGDAPTWRHAAYLVAWPGLDAATFLGKRVAGTRGSAGEWLTALAMLAAGALLFFAGARQLAAVSPYLAGWVGMVGIVLMLHFGIFHLLSCGWRRCQVRARPLMDRPLASTSLGEFWGRRWNTAFRDLTHRFLFQPCTSRFGTRWGLLAGFLFSGVAHDIVISLPARGGYGGPTIYFAIQGAAMVVERSAPGRTIGLGRGLRGRLFAALVLVAPVGWLFHRPFVLGIVLPFMRALGAL